MLTVGSGRQVESIVFEGAIIASLYNVCKMHLFVKLKEAVVLRFKSYRDI